MMEMDHWAVGSRPWVKMQYHANFVIRRSFSAGVSGESIVIGGGGGIPERFTCGRTGGGPVCPPPDADSLWYITYCTARLSNEHSLVFSKAQTILIGFCHGTNFATLVHTL